MKPQPRGKTQYQKPATDYQLNAAINRIQTTAKQSAETAQQIEEKMKARAATSGGWEENDD